MFKIIVLLGFVLVDDISNNNINKKKVVLLERV